MKKINILMATLGLAAVVTLDAEAGLRGKLAKKTAALTVVANAAAAAAATESAPQQQSAPLVVGQSAGQQLLALVGPVLPTTSPAVAALRTPADALTYIGTQLGVAQGQNLLGTIDQLANILGVTRATGVGASGDSAGTQATALLARANSVLATFGASPASSVSAALATAGTAATGALADVNSGLATIDGTTAQPTIAAAGTAAKAALTGVLGNANSVLDTFGASNADSISAAVAAAGTAATATLAGVNSALATLDGTAAQATLSEAGIAAAGAITTLCSKFSSTNTDDLVSQITSLLGKISADPTVEEAFGAIMDAFGDVTKIDGDETEKFLRKIIRLRDFLVSEAGHLSLVDAAEELDRLIGDVQLVGGSHDPSTAERLIELTQFASRDAATLSAALHHVDTHTGPVEDEHGPILDLAERLHLIATHIQQQQGSATPNVAENVLALEEAVLAGMRRHHGGSTTLSGADLLEDIDRI